MDTRPGRQVGMHATCLFCHGPLGANEWVEAFPLGRRLAFDQSRGRLWVVCPRCRGWNLTPLEERWEAIESCERMFRDSRRRVSTDNVGLARLGDGFELIRIGTPERPEFAAWRYGERLILRRRRTMIQVGAGLGVLGAVIVGGAVAGAGIGGAWWGVSNLADWIISGSPNKVITRLPDRDGRQLIVRRKHLKHARLIAERGSWTLRVPGRFDGRGKKGAPNLLDLEGSEALRAAGLLLPTVNRFGGTRDSIRDAVSLLEADADPSRFFARAAGTGRNPPSVRSLAIETRLALEMAAHEDTERRAMEGELADLESAWRDAEEIAAIADDMFLPRSVTDWLSRAKRS